MIVGPDPQDPRWMSNANAVYRAGVTLSTDPLAQRAPFLADQLHKLGRDPLAVEGYGAGARSDSDAVVRIYKKILARERHDGSVEFALGMAPQIADDVRRHGPAIVKVEQTDGRLGYLQINPRGYIQEPTTRLEQVRQQGARAESTPARAAAEYSGQSRTPSKNRAVGYGWKNR